MTRLVTLPAEYAAAPQSLRGRVILITGACGGLGSAAARACADAGATVVLLGRRVRALEKLYDELVGRGAKYKDVQVSRAVVPGILPSTTLVHPCTSQDAQERPQPAIYPLDLFGATPEDYTQLAAVVERECGRLDGVLHAAAHFVALTALEQDDPQEWMRGLHVNLTAPVLLTRACLPLLSRSPDARVVFVLDDSARVERAYWGAYAAAKAGLAGVVSALGDELENSPVRVSGFLPGPMRTPLRARAYFAENPGTVPLPEVYVPGCVYLLGPEGAGVRGATLDARWIGLRAEG